MGGSHHHHHHHEVSGGRLFWTIVLNVLITVSQIVGGIVSGSLALLSDALHNFSDVLSLVIAWGANRLASRPGSETHTFGFKRAEILAALFNASVLTGIALFLIVEAVHKLLRPEAVDSFWVIGLGVLSIVLNTLSVLLIKADARDNMNVKAAYLHLLTDVMTSVAVAVGGVLMYVWGLYWIDPVVSVLIALYLIRASYALILESGGVLMQFAPATVDLDEVRKSVLGVSGLANIHHIHLWRLNDHAVFLEAHLDFREDVPLSEATAVVETLEKILETRFGITHTTFQCEYGRHDDKHLVCSG